MNSRMIIAHLTSLTLILLPTIHAADRAVEKEERPWCDSFSPYKADLSDSGKNPFFFLWPSYRLLLQGGKETRAISVLNETKIIDGVKTRVIEDRRTKDGKLIEVSRSYVTISRTTGDVYCFGKDVDVYKNGKLIGHEGTWMAGANGARLGLLMPGRPAVGDKYHREVAPGVAMDRAEVISTTETLTTPTKVFERCLRTRESSSLTSRSEDTLYAPDVGLIKAGNLMLTGIDCPLCKGTKAAP
ncbi:MAG: hypothetical protein WA117_10835 [Verrucomicrobiia bacterium]